MSFSKIKEELYKEFKEIYEIVKEKINLDNTGMNEITNYQKKTDKVDWGWTEINFNYVINVLKRIRRSLKKIKSNTKITYSFLWGLSEINYEDNENSNNKKEKINIFDF